MRDHGKNASRRDFSVSCRDEEVPVPFRQRVRCQDPETSFARQEDRVGRLGLEQGCICNLWPDRLQARKSARSGLLDKYRAVNVQARRGT